MKTLLASFAAAAALTGTAAVADEAKIRLKEAPETPAVIANCSICHSVDYIQMNSRFMKRAGWDAEIKKMVSVMGAPVSEADQARLLDYLTREYGIAD